LNGCEHKEDGSFMIRYSYAIHQLSNKRLELNYSREKDVSEPCYNHSKWGSIDGMGYTRV